MAYNPQPPTGQAASADSSPVTLSNENTRDFMVVGGAARNALNDNLIAASGSGPFDTVARSDGYSSIRSFTAQIVGGAGITAGAVIFEGSNDGVVFFPIPIQNFSVLAASSAVLNTAQTISGSTSTLFQGRVNFRYLRCRISTAFLNGTVQGFFRFNSTDVPVQVQSVAQNIASNLNAVVTLNSSSALVDSRANPSEQALGSDTHLFNGNTWDRNRNNTNTATGDTGTKTTSFLGTTVTNHNARGAIITVVCGTVSGTSPTLSALLQWSPDGSTWIDYASASPNLTATGQTCVFLVYPTQFYNIGQASALGVGATQYMVLNTVLPRTWRMRYIIGGTTPSFALTGVYVNYVL